MSSRSHLSIGDVLSLLRPEFPDVTISKIRFLESQGLVNPERSPSGYRKFYERDVERLRWVLRQQREHFLPLKVIRDRLAKAGDGVPEDLDEGDLVASDGVDLEAIEVEGPNGVPVGRHADVGVRALDRSVGGARDNGTSDLESGEWVGEPALAGTAAPTRTSAVAGKARANALRADRQPVPVVAPGGGDSRGVGGKKTPEVSDPVTDSGARSARKLAVVEERTAGIDSGPAVEPEPAAPGASAGVPTGAAHDALTLDELCTASGLSAIEVATLEGFGLIEPTVIAGAMFYGQDGLEIAKLVSDFALYGIEPRHLRLYRNAVEREVGLVEHVVTPLLRQRNPEARQRAVDSAEDLVRLGQSLRAALLRREVKRQLGG